MGRVNANDATERELDQARAWIEQRHAVPALADCSLEGRRAFLDVHEAVLWAFWRDLFSLAYASGALRPAAALGATWQGSDEDAGTQVAERLIEALRTRPTLEAAPGWTQIERWHAWLVGKRATEARRPRSRAGSEREVVHAPDGGGAEVLADLERLLDRWSDILRAVVAGTGVAAIELDWLWATRHARKPLSDAFASHPAYGRLADADLDAAIARSSTPGAGAADRTRRSRAGACAAFRFNLEEIARRADGAGALVAARRVFLGPAEPDGPTHRPKLPINRDASAGFWEVLRRSAALSVNEPDDGPVERLWRAVVACGLNKAALRLLPASIVTLVEDDFDTEIAAAKTERARGETS